MMVELVMGDPQKLFHNCYWLINDVLWIFNIIYIMIFMVIIGINGYMGGFKMGDPQVTIVNIVNGEHNYS
jgi:hypothetical protein